MTGQDPWISQTDHPRVVIPGVFEATGMDCTILLDRAKAQWRLYRLGISGEAVLVTDTALRDAARQILGGKS